MGFVYLAILVLWLCTLPLNAALAERRAVRRASRRAARAWGVPGRSRIPASWRGAR